MLRSLKKILQNVLLVVNASAVPNAVASAARARNLAESPAKLNAAARARNADPANAVVNYTYIMKI